MPAAKFSQFSKKDALVSALLMLVLIADLHFICLDLYPKNELDVYRISDFYPLSVFNYRMPELWQLLLGIALFVAFAWLWPRLSKNSHLGKLWALGLGLAFFSNFLHGWRYGIDYPTATWGDSGIEYYHDALWVQGPLWFLQRFNGIQFELLTHARTHPPGPVLLYWGLRLLTHNPGLISIGVTALFLGLGLPYLRRLLKLCFGEVPAGALLLYCILPAVLIYGLATADAVIASLFLACVTCFVDEKRPYSWLTAAAFLALSLFFTFGALFLPPILLAYEFLKKKRVSRSLLVILLGFLALAALKPLCGFNWLVSFLKASHLENEKGFLLFVDPRRYVWYRIGAVAEILFFFTPFLCMLAWRGRKPLQSEAPDYYRLAWLGPLVLIAMLLTGAMKIGEAARLCQFILPFLLLPVIASWRSLDAKGQALAAKAVFAWGLLMQLFGFYQW